MFILDFFSLCFLCSCVLVYIIFLFVPLPISFVEMTLVNLFMSFIIIKCQGIDFSTLYPHICSDKEYSMRYNVAGLFIHQAYSMNKYSCFYSLQFLVLRFFCFLFCIIQHRNTKLCMKINGNDIVAFLI